MRAPSELKNYLKIDTERHEDQVQVHLLAKACKPYQHFVLRVPQIRKTLVRPQEREP